jgi:hypothetical protein
VSEFVARVETDLAPAVAWDRMWDLDRHTTVIPFTRVALDPPATALAVGAGFTGRTALGRLGFDDTMRIEEWRPPTVAEPGRAVVVKTGRLLGGRMEVDVVPAGSGGTRITWRQQVALPWLPRPLRRLEWLAARVAAPGYRRVLRTLLG